MKINKLNIPEGYTAEQIEGGKIVLTPIKVESKCPMSIDEVGNRIWYIDPYGDICRAIDDNSSNQLSTKERAIALLKIGQLKELCDAWNKVDGVEIDYMDIKHKWGIRFDYKLPTD